MSKLTHDQREVSIHALAWRATCARTTDRHWARRFQSTPSRGGRPRHKNYCFYMGQFQSTPSRGGRHVQLTFFHAVDNVSIHALAWRATRMGSLLLATVCSFNPRPRVEGDMLGSTSPASHFWFQSTPSRGGRLKFVIIQIVVIHVSIHALAWRATGSLSRANKKHKVSIHALAWRATFGRI